MRDEVIVVVNPGSTSTKVGLFEDGSFTLRESVQHERDQLAAFQHAYDQYAFRTETIMKVLDGAPGWRERARAVVGRGGLLHPIPGGTYLINDDMLQDLRSARYGDHPCNLGAPIAKRIADQLGVPAFIVDSVVTDELWEVARISGFPKIRRVSAVHALNIKAVARQRAKMLGKGIEKTCFVVCHIGGGISVASLHQGKIVDMNNALLGEGPFSPERAGTLPIGALIDICFSGEYTADRLKFILTKEAGLVGYLGTNDLREVERRIKEGDRKAQLILSAMAFQIAKSIGAATCALAGKIDGIILTGGGARCQTLVEQIKSSIEFIGPIFLHPGEMEMEALAQGALRVLNGAEKAKTYSREYPEVHDEKGA